MPSIGRRSFQTAVITRVVNILGENCAESRTLHSVAMQIEAESADSLVRVSWRTVTRYYNIWLNFKQLPMDCHGNWKWKKGRKSLIWGTQELNSLRAIIDKCPVLFLDEIRDLLHLKHPNKSFSTSSISYAIQTKLKYSRKIVYEKATQQVAQDKENFIRTMREYIVKPEMAIFIDESNKDRKAARRKYGWSAEGTPVNYRSLFNMDTRYTLIGAADCFGFVVPACQVVLHKYKEKDEHKPVDTERFLLYVKDDLCPSLGNFYRQEPHSVVIMDNCSIHLDPRVKTLIEARGAILIYSAPYCPEVIPIEYMFSKWKAFLKRHYIEFNQEWYPVHMSALMSITPQEGLHYFKKTGLVDLAECHPLSSEFGLALAASVLLYSLWEDFEL